MTRKEKFDGHMDDSNSEKSSNLDNEQANICLMVNRDKKVEMKTCYEYVTSVLHQMMKICFIMFSFKTII